VYGERIGKMAACQGINYEVLQFDDNAAVDVIKAFLRGI
jgi:hypothetical protein